MKKIHELRASKSKLVEALDALNKEVEKRDGKMTKQEKGDFDRYMEEIESLNEQIEREERMRKLLEKKAEKAEKTPDISQRKRDRDGKTGEQAEKRKISQEFKLLDLISQRLEGGGLTGVVAEMHQEARNEASTAGTSLNGTGIPAWLGQISDEAEQRDLTAGGSNAGAEFVPTEHRGFIPALRPKLMTEALGIRVLTGLRGNIDIPKQTSLPTGAWEGEVDPNVEVTIGTDKISLAPKRYGGYKDFSKQLLLQSSVSVENMVRSELSQMLAREADRSVINGSGSGQPTGILNVTGIGDVPIDTNGGAPLWDHIVDLETEVAIDNADVGNLAYLTTPGVRGKLKKTKIDTGSGQFVWPVNSREINGHRIDVTTQVPSDLTKASGTALHAILFGNWESYVLGQWGGFDIVIDPYTQAINAMIRITVNMWIDGNLRQAESMAAVKDASIA